MGEARYLVNFDLSQLRKLYTDFLIVGSGVAGLRAAIESSSCGEVLIVTKASAEEGSTGYAQGGIAVALGEHDHPEYHLQDTLRAGDGLCDLDAVKVLVQEGIARVEELIAWGAKFDREKGQLDFTKEGAHTIRRIIHAMGDATGEEVERALLNKVKGIENITFSEHAFVIDLLTQVGRCVGALVQLQDSGEQLAVIARATILAAGGLGQLYEDTTNPVVSTGDGYAIAYRAGCELQDMEFIQFHPTMLHRGETRFLISESVRGEGGILKNIKGERFMFDYHPMGDLAPRDVTSRAIFHQMWRTKSNFVYLDMTHLDPKYVHSRFPNIDKTCLDLGIDVTKDLIPVRPAAHFMMGGVKADLKGETNIKGLFVCGEVASVGVHGANRLASNSLLEGLVYGQRTSAQAARYQLLQPDQKKNTVAKKWSKGEVSNLGEVKSLLRKLMEKQVGIVRCEDSLQEARRTIDKWIHLVSYDLEQPEWYELQNMLITARLVVDAALKRRESRGAHYRSDFPERHDQVWQKHIVFKSQGGVSSGKGK